MHIQNTLVPNTQTFAGLEAAKVNDVPDTTVTSRGSGRLQYAILSTCARMLRRLDYRGLRAATALVAKLFPAGNAVILARGKRRFRVPLNDRFYTWLLDQGFVYELEIEAILDRVVNRDSIFLDCGANHGYWSVYAGQRIQRPERVVAVEATSASFARLCQNRELNENSFTAIHGGIYSKSGLDLEFEVHATRHAGNSCVSRRGTPGEKGFSLEKVKSIALDDIAASITSCDVQAELVVKLDVEGVEIDALQGASAIIARGGLFVYEEHGKDPSCKVTGYLLREHGMAVYWLEEGHEPTRIDSVEQLAKLNQDRKQGYNLIAAKPYSKVLRRALGQTSNAAVPGAAKVRCGSPRTAVRKLVIHLLARLL